MSLTPQAGHPLPSRLKASILGLAGSFIMFAAYLVVPPLGIISGMLAPLPAGYTRLVYGRSTALIITLGTTAALSAMFGIMAGVLYLGMCAVTGLLLPEFLARGMNGSRSLFWTTAVNLGLMALVAAIFSMTRGENLHQAVLKEITASMTLANTLYERSGIKGEELEGVKQAMKMMAELTMRLYPALITVTLAILAGCNLALLKRLLLKAGISINVGDFKTFRTPEPLVWLLIAAGFSLLATSPLITTPALNVMLVVCALYFLQGMAVAGTIIARQSFAGMLRIGLYLMLVIQPYMALFIAAIGLFDLWGDFRTPKKQENL